MRKQYSTTFKAEAIKALMKEEKTINQLAVELDVHPSQLKEWKKIALDPSQLVEKKSGLNPEPR